MMIREDNQGDEQSISKRAQASNILRVPQSAQMSKSALNEKYLLGSPTEEPLDKSMGKYKNQTGLVHKQGQNVELMTFEAQKMMTYKQ